ncbi:unnamed protein product [Pedinophyceae sp. YPF-701]|nr:unnamed protein product [Pedinophyceae sp. YPF-701]
MALAVKFVSLTVKTLAKPLATQFEAYVMDHPRSRQAAIRVAQWLHQAEVSITRGAEGKTGRAFVGQMTDEASVKLASKVASEGFLYATASGLLFYEYRNSKIQADEKSRKAAAERASLDLRLSRLEERASTAWDEARQAQERLAALEDQVLGRRWVPPMTRAPASGDDAPRRTWAEWLGITRGGGAEELARVDPGEVGLSDEDGANGQ